MEKLSVVVITYNEEKNIGRCLQSVESIADEILVVDSFSTDKTEEICACFNKVKFIRTEWQGFTKTKNFANLLATNNLILSIDADEALSDRLKLSIQNILPETENTVYKVNRLTNYCGTWIYHSGWYPDSKIRIFNKLNAHWEGEVHEELKFKENHKIEFLNGDLLHYSYYTIAEHVLQANKYSEIGAQRDFLNGKKPSIFKIIFSPFLKFLRNYIFKFGVLDGYKGFVICVIASFETFLKYTKTRELFNTQEKE